MTKVNIELLSGQTLLVGIEVHEKSFHVPFWTFDCKGVKLERLEI